MEIKNEAHALEMIAVWREAAPQTQRRDISLAIQQLELNAMYYDQKGNASGVERAEKCIRILQDHLTTLGK